MPDTGVDAGITTEKAEHRGHVGVNHSRAFGHPSNAHPAPLQFQFKRHLLVHQIGGEDGVGRCITTRVIQGLHQGSQPSQKGRHGNRHTDHSGGADQHRLRIDAKLIGQHLGGALTVDQTAIAGAGIGLTGVDQHGTGLAGSTDEAITAEINTGRPHHGGGEGAGTNRRLRGQNQCQIRLTRGLQAGNDASGLEPIRCRHTTLDRLPRRSHRHR